VLLNSARRSMGKNDFEKARSSVEQASGLAKTSQQKAQLARLRTILPLVERFREAMKAAVSDLEEKGGQAFTAGNQEIAFVEASEERLVFRFQGTRKTYKWDELPIVLAYGLAELKLEESPKSAAAKASFAAVHPKINNTAKETARKLMQSAAAANAVPADTHEIFDDDYSLD
jgi:RNase adaptor protein for sRNA GlmZ degradation